jgi:hypothetical protein
MSRLAPPPPVRTTTGEDDRLRRFHFRLWQVMISAGTIFATCWVLVLGIPVLSITAIAVAKHVLVAVFCMGLDMYPVQRPR